MKKTIKVKGMHCTSCEMLLNDTLEEIEGVEAAKANHDEGFIEMSFDETKVSEQAIKAAIKKEGFEVQ